MVSQGRDMGKGRTLTKEVRGLHHGEKGDHVALFKAKVKSGKSVTIDKWERRASRWEETPHRARSENPHQKIKKGVNNGLVKWTVRGSEGSGNDTLKAGKGTDGFQNPKEIKL